MKIENKSEILIKDKIENDGLDIDLSSPFDTRIEPEKVINSDRMMCELASLCKLRFTFITIDIVAFGTVTDLMETHVRKTDIDCRLEVLQNQSP